ncbi:MAG: ABC transporter ATP-binding protein [Polyangiales bacterium]
MDKPQAERPASRSPWAALLALARTRARDFVWGAGFLALSSVAAGSVPQAVRRASNALAAGDAHTATRASAFIAVTAAVAAWSRVRSRVHIFNGGREIEYVLRGQILRAVHRLGPSFAVSMSSGEVMSRATNDLGQIRLLLGFGALNLVNVLFAYAVNLPLMFARSPRLAMVSLLPLPFVVLLTRFSSKGFFQRSRAAQEALGSMSELAQRSLSSMRLVRAYSLEAVEESAFVEAVERAREANLALARLRGVLFPVLGFGAAVSSMLVVWLGARAIVEDPGSFSVGDILAFQGHLALVTWPTIALGYIAAILQRGKVSMERVSAILDAEPDIDDRDASPLAAPLEGAVEVRDLRFSFGDGQRVLDGVTLSVRAGERLAIVGRTGAGKSVLARLIARALPTPAGQVFFDGVDVTRIPLQTFRASVVLAQQEPFLFSTTILRNASFALADPDSEGAEAEARRGLAETQLTAEAHAMPQGLDTIVGERGVQLSGGQKQRVALARALLASPRVLVLDDPLSAVDARTEAAILDAIDRASHGRTTLLITHRVAAAARCDRVVVLEGGRVVEEGTHASLLERGGFYARIAERQRIEAELEAM